MELRPIERGITISRDEWLKALGESDVPVDPEAVTVAEFAVEFGIALCTASRKLRRLVAEGKATQVQKFVSRQGSNGSVRVPAFKLVKGKKR